MSFYENGLEKIAAVCVGTASITFGGLGPPGAIEAGIGLAGVAGFILGRRQKFGLECKRVHGRIRKKLLADYGAFIRAEGDDWALTADLEAADTALQETLGVCVIDRKRLIASAVTPAGFPNGAVSVILNELGVRQPNLFGPEKSDGLAYRYAHDVVRAGIEAAVEDLDYYSQLEPHLVLEMAGKLGIIHAAIDAVRDDIRGLQATIEQLVREGEKRAREFGIKEGLLIVLARTYAEGSPDDFEAAFAGLQRALQVAHQEAERDSLPSNVDEATTAVLRKIDDLNAEGKIETAQEVLDSELVVMDEEDALRHAARSRLYEKGISQAVLTRSVENAARFIMAQLVHDAKTGPVTFDALKITQNEWYERGQGKGLNFDLEVTIALNRMALEEWTRERFPLQWAMIQINLGLALSTLGERESGTVRLEEAVAAYRVALEECTRERAPLDWATTETNIGTTLWRLGERESGTVRLEEAVAAYRMALEERTRERVPLDWAATQNGLGNALWGLGARESGTVRLEEAVAAYRTALEERTRERVPLDWAMSQNNLGNALLSLGERESGTVLLEEAVAAYRMALKEWTRERIPLQWAATQTNLGLALSALGQRESGTVRLEEAVVAYHMALEERTRERVPLDWAMSQNSLGNALLSLGERESGTVRLEEAVAAYRTALEERTRERVPLDWAMSQTNLGNALLTLGERESGTVLLEEAVAVYRMALEEWTRERVPLQWAATQINLGELFYVFMEKARSYNDEAAVEKHQAKGVEHIDNAFSILDQVTSPAYYEHANNVRERLLTF